MEVATHRGSLDLLAHRKRRVQEEQSTGPSKRFKCQPCHVSFTQHKSLLRHQRESKLHQHPIVSLCFSCELCHKTFTRAHDLERHRSEQHLDGKIPCPKCGKLIRPKTPHKNPSGGRCDSALDDTAIGKHSASNNQRSDLSTPQVIPEDVSNSVMESLSKQLSASSISKTSMKMSVYKRQVRLRTRDRVLPCGICRMEFEVNDICALARHLTSHFKNFNGAYWCSICEVGFVHEKDLQKHQLRAASGDCGFNFVHAAPCTGHHRPTGNGSDSMTSRSNEDRFNFAYRLRTWEQSQLAAFMLSLETLLRSKMLMQTNSGKDMSLLALWSGPNLQIPSNPGYTPRYARSEYLATMTSDPRFRRVQGWKPNLAGVPSYQVAFAERSDLCDLQNLHTSQDSWPEGPRTDWTRRKPFDFIQSLLHSSVSAEDIDMLAFAIACGADLDDFNDKGLCPLHVAVILQNEVAARLILESGAHSSLCDKNLKQTPLMCAIGLEDFDLAKILVGYGANTECLTEQAIIHTAFNPKILVARRSEPECFKVKNRQPTHEQVWKALDFLICHGAALDAVGPRDTGTALERVAKLGYLEAVKLLLNNGASILTRGNRIHDALSNAIIGRHPKIASYLVEYGAQIREDHLVQAIEHEAGFDIINLLLDRYQKMNSRNYGHQALNAAASKSGLDLVRKLVERGAFIDCNNYKENPVVNAAGAGRLDVVKYLILQGAKLGLVIDGREAGAWALYLAACGGHTEVMSLLISKGVRISDKTFRLDSCGHTVLCGAASRGHLSSMQILLDRGANQDATCENHRTALGEAANKQQTEAVSFLLARGAHVNAHDIDGFKGFYASSWTRLPEQYNPWDIDNIGQRWPW